jgi:hypothetical protein
MACHFARCLRARVLVSGMTPAILLRRGRLQQVFWAFFQCPAAIGKSPGQCTGIPKSYWRCTFDRISNLSAKDRNRYNPLSADDRVDRHVDAKVFWHLVASGAGRRWAHAGGHGLGLAQSSASTNRARKSRSGQRYSRIPGTKSFLSLYVSDHGRSGLHRCDGDLERACNRKPSAPGYRRSPRNRSRRDGIERSSVFLLCICAGNHSACFSRDRAWHPARDCIRAVVHWRTDHLERRRGFTADGVEVVGLCFFTPQIFCCFQRPRRKSRIPASAIEPSAITIEKKTPLERRCMGIASQ